MSHDKLRMDPKGLDPKLKEAYERVMKTTITSKANQQSTTPDPAPASPPPPPAPTTTEPHTETLLSEAPATSASAFIPAQGQSGGTVAKGAKKPMSNVVIAIAMLVFFALYTIIWVMVFHISLPFSHSGTNNNKSGPNQTQSVVPPNPTYAVTQTPTPSPEVPSPTPTAIITPTALPTQSAASGSAH